MNDLISRQAAIDAVKRLSLGETDVTRLAMRIEDYLERLSSAQSEYTEQDMRDEFNAGYACGMEAAQPEQQWIPCSERLPKVGDKVLVSTKNTVFAEVFKGTHESVDSWWWTNNTIKIIYAWMPLPEPYQGEEE